MRSKVEHVFQVVKLKFGFVKLRYRGLKKSAHQLFAICGLVNLFLSRQKLLTASALDSMREAHGRVVRQAIAR